MCGIICVLSANHSVELQKIDSVIKTIKNRGPDFFRQCQFSLTSSWNAYFAASVLHTQGTVLCQQPVNMSNGDILLWNGDVFDGQILSDNSNINLSDTQLLVKWLESCDGNVLELLPKIQGPYSFIYFNQKQKRLWFGRDPLGRHSLLWRICDEEIILSSVGHKSVLDLGEVPAFGVFCIYLKEPSLEVQLHQWDHWNSNFLADELQIAVSIADIKIKFFDNLRLSSCDLTNHFDFFNSAISSSSIELMKNLLQNPNVENVVNELLRLLEKSCEKRINYRQNVCKNCSDADTCSPEHVKFGVLFSGGLDSSIIACMADKFVPKTDAIDLYNVAFYRNHSFDVPDRKTGRLSLTELKNICPNRIWNFLEINVTDEKLFDTRKNRISHLIYPCNTILDESLGCALWFACQGEGSVEGVPVKSSAKILLLGSGADEQLGGYVRHKNLLRRSNWNELQKQLLKETLLISKRNLGRDDRVACDSGRQPRFPFLDESVVDFLAGLAPWEKCDPITFPPGVGDKLILRLVAMKLGLVQCATFPKRAFQFGCRIAKSKEKGDDLSESL